MITQESTSSDSILQWNINGLKANSNELKQLISQYTPFCITLNETRSNAPLPTIEQSFKTYSAHFIPDNTHVGNLILIRKDVNFIPISLNSTLNAIAIEVNRCGCKVKIFSIYLSPNIPINSQALSPP